MTKNPNHSLTLGRLNSVITEEDREYFHAFGENIVRGITLVPDEIREKNVYELEEIFQPSYQHYQFKVAFWKTFTRCVERGLKFDPKDAIRVARGTGYFYKAIINDPVKLWWLMSPIATYEQQSEALLYKALQKKSEMLDIDHVETYVDKEGCERKKLNSAALKIKFDLIKEIEDRAVGPIEKRISQKMQNIPSNIPRDEPGPETIDAELSRLEEKHEKDS